MILKSGKLSPRGMRLIKTPHWKISMPYYAYSENGFEPAHQMTRVLGMCTINHVIHGNTLLGKGTLNLVIHGNAVLGNVH